MKRKLPIIIILLICTLFINFRAQSQLCEWRLINPTFNAIDPDDAGPAVSSAGFTFQVRTVSGSIPNVTAITTGWSWQSLNAMIPVGGLNPGTGIIAPGCTTTSNPANIVLSAAFASAGFLFPSVNECFENTQTVNSTVFDRTAIAILETSTSGLTINTTWMDVFTVTMWARNSSNPRAGFVMVNSSFLGTPGPFSNYEISNLGGQTFEANSLTYTTPLAIPIATLPVSLTKFDVQCQPNKSTSISWTTSQEINNNYFEVEKSVNGTTWNSLNKVTASGNSSTQRAYQINDAQGGTAFYRLKQVDLDGKVTFSNTVKTSCAGRNVYVTLYPVPARDIVTLVIGSDKSIKTALQVFDNKGRMIINMPVSISTGVNNFKVPVQKLAAGEYIIRSSDAGIEVNKRFTVIR